MEEVYILIKKGDTIPGIFSVLVGVLTMIYIFTNEKMVVMNAETYGGIGPGFFPFVCAAALILFGVIMIVQGIKQNGTVDYFQMTPEKKENLKLVGMLALFCLIMLLAWKVTKMFFLCLPIYIFAMNRLLKRSWLFTILFTAGMTLFIYGLFRMGFSIRFRP